LILEFITDVSIILEVEKILSENFLYRPSRGKGGRPYLRLDETVRAYKEQIKENCEVSGFHEQLTEIVNSNKNIAVISKYSFFLPVSEFFFKDGRIGKSDVTNMLKAVEDSVLGTVIDDSNVLQNTIVKAPHDKVFSIIVAEFEFYNYAI
jgi:hypothetical protein